MLDKTGKSIPDMSDDDKKKFFNAVDKAYKAKSEGKLTGYTEAELTAGQKKLDVDGDGEIEASDLAALRAKKDESVNEEEIKWNAVQNAIINFLKMNTKILDKRVQAKDTDGVKGGLNSIISGLTNAQRSLKLESVNEVKFYAFFNNKKHEIEGKDLLDAKQKAITMLKVPKSKVGLLAIVNANAHDKGSFRYESVNEENPGLWANIRAKQARGEKPAHGNSDAHKDAVKAAKSINKGESVKKAGLKGFDR
jgi:hypothetical protein